MGAGVGILAGVMENVSTELRGLDKRLAAKLARMRFFTCVGAHMTIQSFFSGKSVMTLFTSIGPLSCVHSSVFLHGTT
jgi:hypothetical protein